VFRRQSIAQPQPSKRATGTRYPPNAVVDNRYRIHTLARQQRGLATWAQLERRGVANATLTRALAADRLYPVFETVYSVVPPELMTDEAWHAAAVLKGGSDSCLCGASGAWWLDLVEDQPEEIHVAIKGQRKTIEGIRWHRLGLGEHERINHNRMPVTAPARIPLDLATDATLWELKGVLAELEFHYGVGPEEVPLRKGFPGSAKLRRAIAEHTPQLASTREELERRYVHFSVERRLELPVFNHPVGLSTVDAIYAERGVVVELDGVRGHTGERRVLRDHRRDLHRRADGLQVLRYHFTQIVNPPDQDLVEADLLVAGIRRVG
jgi:very-short-patch-repair endonuclease